MDEKECPNCGYLLEADDTECLECGCSFEENFDLEEEQDEFLDD
jgi:RNA polymerase subunit RPABC4/transcription elongation factor Spt4